MNIFRALCAALVLQTITTLITPVSAATTTPTNTATPSVTTILTPSVTATPTETATPTPTPTPDVALYIQAKTEVGTQYPWNKAIPVKVTAKPLIPGQRIEIVWEDKSGIKVTPERRTIQGITKDQVYTTDFEIIPQSSGILRLTVNVILTTDETKYINSIPHELRIDRSFTVQPISSQYRFYEVMQFVLTFLVIFVLIPGSLYLFYKYIKNVLVPKWINKQMETAQ